MKKELIELKEELLKRYNEKINNSKSLSETAFKQVFGELQLTMVLSSCDPEFRAICDQLGKIQELEIEEKRMEEMFPGIVQLSDETGYNIHVCYRLFMAAGDDAVRIIKEAKEKGYYESVIYEMSDFYFQVEEYMGIKLHGPTDFKKLGEELDKLNKTDKLPRKLRKGW